MVMDFAADLEFEPKSGRGVKFRLGFDSDEEWDMTTLPASLNGLREPLRALFDLDEAQQGMLDTLSGRASNPGKCVYFATHIQGNSIWTTETFAYRTCTTTRRTCILRKDRKYVLLPLPPKARFVRAGKTWIAGEVLPTGSYQSRRRDGSRCIGRECLGVWRMWQ